MCVKKHKLKLLILGHVVDRYYRVQLASSTLRVILYVLAFVVFRYFLVCAYYLIVTQRI